MAELIPGRLRRIKFQREGERSRIQPGMTKKETISAENLGRKAIKRRALKIGGRGGGWGFFWLNTNHQKKST